MRQHDCYWAPNKSSCWLVTIHQVLLVLEPANHTTGIRTCEFWGNNNIQLMVALTPHEELLKPRQVLFVRDEVEPNNTCQGFNNSSCWARWLPSIVLLLHFGIN